MKYVQALQYVLLQEMDTLKALILIPFVSDYFFLSYISACHIIYAHRIVHKAALWSGSRKLLH